MCSVGDDMPNENKFMEKSNIKEIKICNKCKVHKPNVLLQYKHGYCKTCFINGTVHKFKAFLGKHHFIRKGDHVLINFSFGHATSSLLHFLRTGIDITTPKKLKFHPVVLYVEKNYYENTEQRKKLLQDINEFTKQFGFDVHFVSFVDYVLNSKVNVVRDYRDIVINEYDREEILKVFDKRGNATMETEVCKQFHHQLLISCAKKLECQHVFMCDVAIDVASQILTSTALGRGGHLEMDTGICDVRDSEVNIIRPLRGFDIKELALYNFYNNIEPLTIKQPQMNPYSSIQNLMLSFVENLRINFPATVTTVVKTGDKLSMDKNIWQNKTCTLCMLPIENETTKLTSAEATEFSHWISTHKPISEGEPTEIYNEVITNFKSDNKNYCFACSRISKYLIKD